MSVLRAILLAILLVAVSAEAAPFFDAVYDAVIGNGRRTYGYDGYGQGYYNYNQGYNNPYYGYGRSKPPRRQEKTWKDICRVHFPDSIAQPGSNGITCPY